MSPFCRGEGKNISENELLQNPDGSFFRPYVHNIPGDRHYVDTGESVSYTDDPPGVSIFVKTMLQNMSKSDLQEVIKSAEILIEKKDSNTEL